MKEHNNCIRCGFYDADYGCTCSPYDKWYACPEERKKPENVKALKEYAEELTIKDRSALHSACLNCEKILKKNK